jgi:hypothetical protein
MLGSLTTPSPYLVGRAKARFYYLMQVETYADEMHDFANKRPSSPAIHP